jgi:hypothetical protein
VPAAQEVQLLNPAVEYFPAVQETQVVEEVAPTVALYLPAEHCVQEEEPEEEYVPALQVMQLVAPAKE